MRCYTEFEFDLPEALLERLVNTFEQLDSGLLNAENLDGVPNAQGVYQLFLDNDLVYIGKTDAEAGLKNRLSRHSKKILERMNMDPHRVSFKAIRVLVFSALDLESSLIKHYGGTKAVAWNGSGFGSNDPGRERDTSKLKEDHFDALYPIDIEKSLDFQIRASESVAECLSRLRASLSYVVRFQRSGRAPHSDLKSTKMDAEIEAPNCWQVIEMAIENLPKGWQATALPGYIILYKESKNYPQAQRVARS